MAEKKSTKVKSVPKKHVTAKVEEPAPLSEVQRAVEPVKPLSINWDVMGLSTAAITILGTALLFMMGWAYEVNWYGYFGVRLSQVVVQPQDVLIQSIPGIVTASACLIAAILSYSLFHLTVEMIKGLIHIQLVDKLPERPPSGWKIPIIPYSRTDWMIVFSLTELFQLAILITYLSNWLKRFTNFGALISIYEIFYLPFLVFVVLIVLIGAAFLFFFIYQLVQIIAIIYLVVRSLFKPKKKGWFQDPIGIKVPQSFSITIIVVFFIILTTLSLSAIYGVNDATNGYRGSGGWKIQPVLVITRHRIYLAESIDQVCEMSECVSGPFGFLGENEDSYTLIRWTEDNEYFFDYHPGLYIVPKGESTYLIPFASSSVSTTTPPKTTPTPIQP